MTSTGHFIPSNKGEKMVLTQFYIYFIPVQWKLFSNFSRLDSASRATSASYSSNQTEENQPKSYI